MRQNQLRAISRELGVRQYRIASGRQQPRMEDGPSFFSIQNKMRNQVRGRQAAIDNIADASSMLNVLEVGLRSIDEVLGRMRDLTVRAANGIINFELREDIQLELDQLAMAIDLVANTTCPWKFATRKLECTWSSSSLESSSWGRQVSRTKRPIE
jgi:flagellin